MRKKKKAWILVGSFLVFLIGYNIFTYVYAENQEQEKDAGYTLIHAIGHELIRIDSIFAQIKETNEVTSDLASQLAWSSEQLEYLTRLISYYVDEDPNKLALTHVGEVVMFTNTLASQVSSESILLDSSQAEALEILRQEISSLTTELEPAKTLDAETNSGFHPKDALQNYMEQLESYSH